MLNTGQLMMLIVGVPLAIVLAGILILALSSQNKTERSKAGTHKLERHNKNKKQSSPNPHQTDKDDIPNDPDAAMQWLEALAKKHGTDTQTTSKGE